MISVQNCVEVESGSLFAYASSSREDLLKAVIDEGILKRADETITMKYVQQERKASYHQKPMHGQFAKIAAEQGSKETWAWLRQGTLKKETDGTIMAAQDQALPTNAMKANIHGQNISPLCRMCGKENETVAHIVSSCEKLTQKYYKQWRHDKVAQILHWNLCKKYDLQAATKFYDHVPEKVSENDLVKILWDFNIQTDKKLEHNKPDITLQDKKNNECLLIEVSCPFDMNINEVEEVKLERHQALKWELKKIWNCKRVKIIPIIIGALGTVNAKLGEWLKSIDIKCNIGQIQQASLLGTGRILRKVLDT